MDLSMPHLLPYIHKYYPIGMPRLRTDQEDEIRKIITEKLDYKSDVSIRWNSVVSEFRTLGFNHVENMSYLQFPSLMASLDLNHEVENIKVTKSFVMCISLLAPYYTYYFRYSHRVKLDLGSLPLGYWAFFNDLSCQLLKPPIDINLVNHQMQRYFPNHEFVSHFTLMINQVGCGLPYGFLKEDYLPSHHSYYQFLFDNEQPLRVFT
jgi:hypothetical protein